VNFSQFPAVTHTLRLNCTEMAGDGPGQPAYKVFSIEHTFLKSKFRSLKFKESSDGGLKFKYSFKMH